MPITCIWIPQQLSEVDWEGIIFLPFFTVEERAHSQTVPEVGQESHLSHLWEALDSIVTSQLCIFIRMPHPQALRCSLSQTAPSMGLSF